jgi:hypothetical protein
MHRLWRKKRRCNKPRLVRVAHGGYFYQLEFALTTEERDRRAKEHKLYAVAMDQ